MTDVCLVLMPYADVERPALGLSLLKSAALEKGLSATVLYANLWAAEGIGLDAYNIICQSPVPSLLGEWTFSSLAFPEFHPDEAAFLELALSSIMLPPPPPRLSHEARVEAYKKLLGSIRAWSPRFIERVAKAVLKLQPRIVGCSSSFQQHCSSLALLRRIKELAPEIITCIGGANCEGPMGQATHRAFPWVDYVVSGEADQLFGDLCRRLVDEDRELEASALPLGVFGPAHRRNPTLPLSTNGVKPPAPRAVVRHLDEIPTPNFDDYFETLSGLPISACIKPALTIETSRGCWWGEKHHCTFCGLNGSGMGYRSKSSGRVLAEFEELSQRYHLSKFEVVDNILDMRYLETVLPTLAVSPQPYSIFYETKANLKREQLVKLAEAGIRAIQPGIENMHDAALKLLDKGNNAWINIQLLKWSLEAGINVHWSFLVNMPDEVDAWYFDVVGWLPLISHLQPPMTMSQIRFDRFSPYFERPADYGIKIRPYRTFGYVYPLPPEELADLAYFFEDEQGSGHYTVDLQRDGAARPGLLALKACLDVWGDSWRLDDAYKNGGQPKLEMVDCGGRLTITDTRACAVDRHFVLEGLAYRVYKACDQALTPPALALAVGAPAEELEPVIAELCRQKLLLALNGRLLSLAVSQPNRPLLSEHPGGEVNVLEYIRLKRFVAQATALS